MRSMDIFKVKIMTDDQLIQDTWTATKTPVAVLFMLKNYNLTN